MADISKCDGKKCKLKDCCFRYTARSSDLQAWINPEKRGYACEFFLTDYPRRESKQRHHWLSKDANF